MYQVVCVKAGRGIHLACRGPVATCMDGTGKPVAIFLLITNDRGLSPAQVLEACQPMIEKCFDQVKTKHENPFFFRNECRLDASFTMRLFALIVQALIQRELPPATRYSVRISRSCRFTRSKGQTSRPATV